LTLRSTLFPAALAALFIALFGLFSLAEDVGSPPSGTGVAAVGPTAEPAGDAIDALGAWPGRVSP
jgi:hypothetical protein